MRLSAIRLAGFKSFVDRTQLTLDSNLTAVVGPNGCGKSNLIDAVRWVLGESSAKQLRGAALSDVIFNGSKTRKPVGRAMIELVFDNSDATVGGAYAQFGEIAVRRELSRDGGSQFSINGTRCRRKDITELFLGTGLGVRSNYAIIEQGTVSRLIEAQPEELRQMLEESAGISRYKEKRRETEIRIRHTRENLERLEDLLSEIDERLAKLQRQARAAQRFKQYKQEQRSLRRQLLGLRWRELDAEATVLKERLDALGGRRDQAARALAQATEARTLLGETAEQAAQNTQDSQAAYYAAEADLARSRQELKHAQDMARLREREAAELGAEHERLEAQFGERLARAEQLARQLDELAPVIEAAQGELQALENGFGERENRAADAAQALEELRRALQAPRTVAATEQVRLEQLEKQLERNRQREAQCREELAGIDLAELAKQMAAAQQAETAAVRNVAAADEQAGARIRAVEAAREERSEADQQLHELRQRAQECHAELAALRAEQARALASDDESRQAWLEAQGWGDAQPLGRHLAVEAPWTAAVEAVLGPWLQAPCVPGPLTADREAPPWLIEAQEGDDPVPADSLAEMVAGPRAARLLLACVRRADDAAAAARILPELAAGEAVVTPEGSLQWRGAQHWPTETDGVLQREARLKELVEQEAVARRQLEAGRERHAAAEAALKQAESDQQQALEELDAARRQNAEARGAMQRLSERHEALVQRRDQRDAELKDLQRLHAELAADQETAQAALEASRQDASALEDQERQAQEKADAARAELQNLRGRRQDLQRQLEAQRERRAQMATELAAVQAARDALAARRDEVSRSLASARVQQNDEDSPLPALQQAVAAAEQQQRAAQAGLGASRAAQEAAAAEARKAGQAVLAAEQAVQQAREALQEQQFAEQRLLARREGLSEQFRQAGVRPDEVLADLPAETQLAACEEELGRLEERINRLGAVNLAAVEEYDQEKERADHLRAQEADLTEALEKLEDAIRQIDKETRNRFRQTFDAVNEKFQARFPKLFGGGEAYLELSGEDVLDAGVRVMARPPGKRNSSIQLLSGGEKALTAVSLVFALFELNPAPFCMLDEVDAPLDDANVVRYCEVVREMSDRVQFIIVTHNKITMELADQLNGVTMQEAGVSRLVSVDVQQAVALAG